MAGLELCIRQFQFAMGKMIFIYYMSQIIPVEIKSIIRLPHTHFFISKWKCDQSSMIFAAISGGRKLRHTTLKTCVRYLSIGRIIWRTGNEETEFNLLHKKETFLKSWFNNNLIINYNIGTDKIINWFFYQYCVSLNISNFKMYSFKILEVALF